MAETEQSPTQSPTTTTTTNPTPNISFSVWPPTDRTREAVRTRLIETLSSPSILSKRYGTVSRDEAVEAAKAIEAMAFDAASGNAATTDEDGIEILQFYSKEISKRMLDTVKARAGEGVGPAAPVKAAEEEEENGGGSEAPPQSENTESVVADDE